MDVKELHRRLLVWSGPLNHQHVFDLLNQAIAEAKVAERKACAKTAEECWVEGDNWRRDIAAAIRWRE
jgi:hypothetical protein